MLRMTFIWPGPAKEAWLSEGINNYLNRIKNYHTLKVVETKAVKGRGRRTEKTVEKESASLIKALPAAAFAIALDEHGKLLPSTGLAELINRVEEEGRRDLAFITGGPYGLSSTALSRCNMQLSLSPMTFTHDMARLILAEQVYRACTIRAGTPYHHE